MTDDLQSREDVLRAWHEKAEPTAENFRKYADELKAIYEERKAAKKMTRALAAMYMTEYSAYYENANALETMKNESTW